MARILVLDASGILPWRVRYALGDGHEVIATASLDDAERMAHTRRLDAAVVSVPHRSLPLRSFHDHCLTARPPLPVLYESCVPGGLAALGLQAAKHATLLAKPAQQCELARALAGLVAEARELRAAVPAPVGPAASRES